MIDRRQFLTGAGSILSLPFFCLAPDGWAAQAPAQSKVMWIFEEFASSCIDLGRYDPKTQQLTVRFVNKKTDKFYRYSNVRPEVWKKLRELNESGGVGGYLNDQVVQYPKKFPFEELIIGDFKTVSTKKTSRPAVLRQK